MLLYPRLYLESVKQITIQMLEQNNIKGLILDVDNTLIDFDKNMPEGIKEWAYNMKENGIKLCIVSNSNHKEKVENTAKKIEVPYIFFAKKPFIKGLNKAKKIMNLTNEAIAVVGDQIFTDVIGANRAKMFPILVKPINEKDIWITKFKRPIENKIIQRYLKKNKGEKNVHQ